MSNQTETIRILMQAVEEMQTFSEQYQSSLEQRFSELEQRLISSASLAVDTLSKPKKQIVNDNEPCKTCKHSVVGVKNPTQKGYDPRRKFKCLKTGWDDMQDECNGYEN